MILQCKCGFSGIPMVRKNGPHITARCAKCQRFIKHLPKTAKAIQLCKNTMEDVQMPLPLFNI